MKKEKIKQKLMDNNFTTLNIVYQINNYITKINSGISII